MDIVLRTEQEVRQAEAVLLLKINESPRTVRAFMAAPFHFLREIGVRLEGDFALIAEAAVGREDEGAFREALSSAEPERPHRTVQRSVIALVGPGTMPTLAQLREGGVL